MIRRRLIIPLCLVLIAGACASSDNANDDNDYSSQMSSSSDASPKSRYAAAAGESPVGAIPDAVLHDNDRNKDLTISIDYPTRGTAHPLIVFSPGFGGSNRGYIGLASWWASNGYVVIRASHADAGRVQDLRSLNDIWESQTPSDWRNRVRDITFILDSLGTLEQRYPELAGKIDHARIGVGGHSYGAYTAMLVGGARTFPGGTSYADPRVKAIVAMSPQGPSETRGLTNESFTTLRVPALFMTGTMDRGVTDAETPDWRRQAFELSPAGDKWLAVLEGATHATFTGRSDQFLEMQAREQDAQIGRNTVVDPATGAIIEDRRPSRAQNMALRARATFGTVRALSLAFWDTYLGGDAKGREELQRTRGNVELKSK
ncbi:MAG: alpha/beta fold hydrolase [Acidobacteria bacterium]|nr:alpha/beta fold hydrolase [Acidobacteriota bacterium]MBV9477612.1 alpha/beta fold hydrolase [Acidobacteriota bacterium]